MNGIHVLEAVVGLVAVVVAVTALARRFGLLAPILLVVVGLALSFVPGLPDPRDRPGARDRRRSCRRCSTWRRWRPRCRRSGSTCGRSCCSRSGTCCSSRAAVGFVVHALLPAVPLAACFALGAVVAPPDAIAATAVARRIGLPRRMVTILEGESLLNDATALVLFRVAVGGGGRRGGRAGRHRRARWCVAAGGGVAGRCGRRGRVPVPAPADHRPAAGQRAVAADAVRGRGRRPRRSTAPASSRSWSPGSTSVTGCRP